MNSPNHTHEFGKIFEDNVPCGNRPQLIRRCKTCGYTEVVGLSGQISEHNFSKQEIIKPSTCTSPGEAILTCTKCGEKKSVSLPLTNHQYQTNNPFYKKCTICQKAELTPLAKRSLVISGTCFFIAGGATIAITSLPSSISSSSSIMAESSTSADVTYTAANTYNSSIDKSNSYQETLFTKYILPDNHVSNHISKSISSETETSSETTSETVSETASETAYETESLTEPASEESTAPSETITETVISEYIIPETEQISSSEDINTKSTQQTSTMSTSTTKETTTESPKTTESAKTEESPNATESTKSKETTTNSVDYSDLIGKLFYGSEILDYIDTGIPVELITVHGEKYFANIGDNNFDSSVIISTDLYTVNTSTYDGQTIVIFNQL